MLDKSLLARFPPTYRKYIYHVYMIYTHRPLIKWLLSEPAAWFDVLWVQRCYSTTICCNQWLSFCCLSMVSNLSDL